MHSPHNKTISNNLTVTGDGATILAGRYKIQRKLGEGGMGSVWLAADKKLDDRQVAIKMLPSIFGANRRAIQQLKQEARLAMKLSHPHIVMLRPFEDMTCPRLRFQSTCKYCDLIPCV